MALAAAALVQVKAGHRSQNNGLNKLHAEDVLINRTPQG
jgi:hypothetical protein